MTAARFSGSVTRSAGPAPAVGGSRLAEHLWPPTDTVRFSRSQSLPSRVVVENRHPLDRPWTATVRMVRPLTPDVSHIELDVRGANFQVSEGQSLALVLPKPDGSGVWRRYYSVASSARGEDGHGQVLALCIKHGQGSAPSDKPSAARQIAALRPGDPVQVAGPFGRDFLAPPSRQTPLVLVATGVGLAPFRGFLKARLENQLGPLGMTRLYAGYRQPQDALYDAELRAMQRSGLVYRPAFSRVSRDAAYVADRLGEDADALWAALNHPDGRIYLCGMPAMVAPVEQVIRDMVQARHGDGDAFLARLKQEGRWRVAVF